MSELAARRLTLGTAGHIDHGKTALVAALTGTDTDRLAEERRRGISIELGFAELHLGDGRTLSVVDVPGHERLVRTMVAGATGVDLYLLVVAADDGVMPQTREHVAVLRALGVEHGVLALTKSDLAGAGSRGRVAREVGALLPGVPLVEVSARTGAGIEALRSRLAQVAAATPRRGAAAGPPVLHVDRVFTLHGIGTVVTGTLRGGDVGRGETLEILPRGLRARVRSIEVHGSAVERAEPGQRVALNLAGVERAAIARGDVAAAAGSGVAPSYRLDVELALEPGTGDLDGERVQVHHGTRDAPARVVVLDAAAGFAQLRLEAPLIARSGDRFVLRRIAPPDTIGGGAVLDPAPRRHGPGPAVERLHRIRERGLASLVEEERERAAAAPAARELRRPQLDRLALLVLAVLRRDGSEPRAPRGIAEAVGVEPARVAGALDALVAAGQVERASGEVYFAKDELARLRARAVELGRERGELTLPALRDALGTSRKYAQAVLEHLDSTRFTVRHGDHHVLRRPR